MDDELTVAGSSTTCTAAPRTTCTTTGRLACSRREPWTGVVELRVLAEGRGDPATSSATARSWAFVRLDEGAGAFSIDWAPPAGERLPAVEVFPAGIVVRGPGSGPRAPP